MYMYIYIHIHTHICICTYIYTQRERDTCYHYYDSTMNAPWRFIRRSTFGTCIKQTMSSMLELNPSMVHLGLSIANPPGRGVEYWCQDTAYVQSYSVRTIVSNISWHSVAILFLRAPRFASRGAPSASAACRSQQRAESSRDRNPGVWKHVFVKHIYIYIYAYRMYTWFTARARRQVEELGTLLRFQAYDFHLSTSCFDIII